MKAIIILLSILSASLSFAGDNSISDDEIKQAIVSRSVSAYSKLSMASPICCKDDVTWEIVMEYKMK